MKYKYNLKGCRSMDEAYVRNAHKMDAEILDSEDAFLYERWKKEVREFQEEIEELRQMLKDTFSPFYADNDTKILANSGLHHSGKLPTHYRDHEEYSSSI